MNARLSSKETAWRLPREVGLRVSLVLLGSVLMGCKEVRTTGYLTQGPPRSLHFAPPVHFVALPPLPKSSDLQPPAPLIADVAEAPEPIQKSAQPPPAPIAPPRDAVGAAPVPTVTGTATNQPNKVDFTLRSSGLFPPEVLLRFFPTGKPAGVEVPVTTEPVPFQTPALIQPSSSAVYEVK